MPEKEQPMGQQERHSLSQQKLLVELEETRDEFNSFLFWFRKMEKIFQRHKDETPPIPTARDINRDKEDDERFVYLMELLRDMQGQLEVLDRMGYVFRKRNGDITIVEFITEPIDTLIEYCERIRSILKRTFVDGPNIVSVEQAAKRIGSTPEEILGALKKSQIPVNVAQNIRVKRIELLWCICQEGTIAGEKLKEIRGVNELKLSDADEQHTD
jgi:hypothetical protein